MATITGIVEAKSKTEKSILVEGNWYGSKYPIKFNKGDTVTIESDPSGKFIKKISGDAATPSVGGDAPAPKKEWGKGGSFPRGKFPIDHADGQRSIIRQNALTNARETVLTAIEGGHLKVDNFDDIVAMCIKTAYTYEKYTAGDYEAEARTQAKHEAEEG